MAGAAISNLGPSYRFHYLPGSSDNHKYNLDSAEYANIVCGFLVAYRQARDGGMAPLDATRAGMRTAAPPLGGAVRDGGAHTRPRGTSRHPQRSGREACGPQE